MIKNLMILFLFLANYLEAQKNLVVNGGFEINTGCPTHYNLNHHSNSGPLDIPFLADWVMPNRHAFCIVGSADYQNTCSSYNSCPFGAHNGNGYVQFIMSDEPSGVGHTREFKEYICSKLNTKMITGHLYHVQFFISNSLKNSQLGTVGALFTTQRPRAMCQGSFIDDNPVANIQNNQILTNSMWQRISGDFVATDNFEWITLGDFENKWYSNLDGVKVYSIDDVTVVDVGSSECPEWNLIENVDYWDDISLTYKSSYVTAVGTSVDNAQTDGPVHIHNVSKITLKSEREVMMEADFSVDEGGELNAFIAPCNADCFPPSVNAGEDKFICSETSPIYVGIPTGYNPDLTYSWTSTPATFTSNLSCTNCPNPNLLINATTLFGSAIYQVTATNACGQTATDNVNVFFDLHWMDYNATVNAYNINPDNYIDFDITCNNHTEWVQIEIYKNSDNSLVYSKQLKRGDNFTSIPFHWEIDQYLKVCDDYTLKIYSKNFCNPTLSNIQTIPWVRNKTITIGALPNVFTPPNPPNAALCYNTTGVDEYEIYVYDPSGGVLIYSNSGDYAPTGGCLWNGTCNGSLATCPTGYAPNGVYQIIVKFKNCLNQEDRAHFVHLYNDPKKQNDNTDNPINRTVTQLFPNPNNGIFTITPSSLLSTNYTIEITDNLNKVIYKVENKQDKTLSIDLSQYGKGIYFIRIYNTIENYFNKLIIN